jgi:DNA-binding transcriptional LysR family regulator
MEHALPAAWMDATIAHIMMSRNAHPDWDNVRAFLAVARSGRVAAAARTLGVNHTTVSRRLATLEAQLGSPLFYRTTAGYQLTPAGETILANAEAMEQAAVTIGARVRERTGRLQGRVRVAMAPEFASHWLSRHLTEFRRQYPAISLQVLVGTRTLDLSRGEAELAVRTPRPHQVGLITSRLAVTATALYASREFVGKRRLRITDVASARAVPFLVYTPSLQLLQGAEWFQPLLEAADVVLETNGTHALLEAARSSLGVAVLPTFVARAYDDLVKVSEHVAEHDLWIATHPDFRRDPRVRATSDFLKAIAHGPNGLS